MKEIRIQEPLSELLLQRSLRLTELFGWKPSLQDRQEMEEGSRGLVEVHSVPVHQGFAKRTWSLVPVSNDAFHKKANLECVEVKCANHEMDFGFY